MKRAAVLLMTVVMCAGLAAQTGGQGPRPELLAGAKVIESDAALQEWLNFYYLHPRPDLAVSAWKRISLAQMFENAGMRPGLTAFFAELIRKNPGLGMQLLPEAHDEASRFVLAYAVWLANADESTAVLDALKAKASEEQGTGLKDMLYSTPPDLVAKPITSEWDLDGLWSSFFASGDSKYVEKIASALVLAEKADPVSRNIASEARRSLLINGREHQRVREICSAELARVNEPEKDALAEVVKELKQ